MNPPDVLISPKYRLSDFGGHPSTDEKINIFEDRVKGWFLDIAAELLEQSDSEGFLRPSFAVLAILAVYFEMIGQYASGLESQRASRGRFVEGVELVFPGKFNESQARNVYKALRCSLYHNGLTKGAIVGNAHDEAMVFKDEVVWINPKTLFEGISIHFATYIGKLRNPEELDARDKFERMYNLNPKL